MKYTTKIFGSLLAMVLIMTLSPAQSMEMTTSHELAESGIIINFSQKPDASSAPPTVTGTTEKPQTVAPPPQDQLRFELAESGQTLIFSNNDDPTRHLQRPVRTIAKPYVETPAPLAGNPYHARHSFEMAESGHIISFPDTTAAPPKSVDPDIMACK